MTTAQKVIKYIALALAVCLIVGIISGIIRLAGGLSYIFSRNEPNSDLTNEYTDISDAEHISILDIELEYAQLIIKNGDGFKVETSDKEITVKFDKKNSKLTIKEPDRMFHSTKGETVILYIPENSEFESVEIDSGAGTVEVEALSVNDLTLDLGAGKAEFNELFVTRAADIDCGTGATTIGKA